MKKIVAILLLCLMLICLTSCATISGKYTLIPEKEGYTPVTLHFTRSGEIHVYEGKYDFFKAPVDTLYYRIDGNTIYTWTEHTQEQNAKGMHFEKGRDAVGTYIMMGEVPYYKK